ncbi:MAG: hypothetical protein JO056_12810 [Alphaproteobacteria bacterium]|nr:hypothetical protein [Alphaproteobacteria bacterium]
MRAQVSALLTVLAVSGGAHAELSISNRATTNVDCQAGICAASQTWLETSSIAQVLSYQLASPPR